MTSELHKRQYPLAQANFNQKNFIMLLHSTPKTH